MSKTLESFINHIFDKIENTSEGKHLLRKEGLPELQVLINKNNIGLKQAVMGFEYPDSMHIDSNAFPNVDNYSKSDPNNPHFEAKVTLAILHELLHREQSRKAPSFFKGNLEPAAFLSSQILIEADNYARTAQLGWRLATEYPQDFGHLKTYMESANTKSYLESSLGIYAAAMKDKPITDENELKAMQQVAEDFFMASHNAQRYTRNRIDSIWDYLQTGRLQEKIRHMDRQDARVWLATNPILAGFGPDAQPFIAGDFHALGETGAGNLLDFDTRVSKHFSNPRLCIAFMDETDQAKLLAIEEFSQNLRRHLAAPKPTSRDSGFARSAN